MRHRASGQKGGPQAAAVAASRTARRRCGTRASPAAAGATAVVRLTSRATGEVQELRLVSKAAAAAAGSAAAAAAGGSGTGLGLLEPARPSGDNPPLASEAVEVAAALLARDQPLADGPDASAVAVRRRLLGSGPWPLHGVGDLFLLRGGRAHH